jgi:hypothetical protein
VRVPLSPRSRPAARAETAEARQHAARVHRRRRRRRRLACVAVGWATTAKRTRRRPPAARRRSCVPRGGANCLRRRCVMSAGPCRTPSTPLARGCACRCGCTAAAPCWLPRAASSSSRPRETRTSTWCCSRGAIWGVRGGPRAAVAPTVLAAGVAGAARRHQDETSWSGTVHGCCCRLLSPRHRRLSSCACTGCSAHQRAGAAAAGEAPRPHIGRSASCHVTYHTCTSSPRTAAAA